MTEMTSGAVGAGGQEEELQSDVSVVPSEKSVPVVALLVEGFV